MGHRKSQMRDTGFEVIHEAGDPTFLVAAVIGDDAGGKLARNGAARTLVGGLNPEP